MGNSVHSEFLTNNCQPDTCGPNNVTSVQYYVRRRLQLKTSRMTTSTKLFVILVIVMAIFPCIFGGHLVHDFYKCSSDWYRSFFKRCKRNLEYENAGSVTGSNVFMLLVSAALYYML